MLAELLEPQQAVSFQTFTLGLLLLELLLHVVGKCLLLGLLGLLLLGRVLGLLLGLMLLCRLHHLRIGLLGLARGRVRLRPGLSLPLLRSRCLI